VSLVFVCRAVPERSAAEMIVSVRHGFDRRSRSNEQESQAQMHHALRELRIENGKNSKALDDVKDTIGNG
jgi:hypothetical protein